MATLRNFYLGTLALVGASTPIAAYTGYYAPDCGWSAVWSLSGYAQQFVCF
jgi:hypothetical protein